MRKAHDGRSLQLLVVASCLLASLSAAGGEPGKQEVEVHLPASVAAGQRPWSRNGKASLQRALDTLEPLVASPAGQGLTATVRALREDSRHAFFDVSRVQDARALERTLRLREELQRLWPSGRERPPAASSALSDLLLLVQQAAYVAFSDARLLFGSSPSIVHAPRVAKGTPAFREAERAWEEASQQLARGQEFLEEMIRTTPEEVLYGRGQVLRLNGRVTLSVKKSALRPKNGTKYLTNIRKHLSSALAEHRSLSVLPGDGEDLIKVGHVAGRGPDRVLKTGSFIDVLEVKAFGSVVLSHLGRWIIKQPDPKNPGKFIYEFDGDILERHLRVAGQPTVEELLDAHTLRYHLFIYAPDTALTRELADLFSGSDRSIPIKGLKGSQIILTMTRHWD